MARSLEQEAIASQAGFESYLGLMEGSTPVATGDGLHWYVCPVSGGWGAWNSEELKLVGGFAEIGAAQDHVRANTGRLPAPDADVDRPSDAAAVSDRLAAGAELKPYRP